MVSRKLLKTEIDKVKNEYLELLYGIIRLLENGTHEDVTVALNETEATEAATHLVWRDFIANTYGCLAEAPISRAEQGHYEGREVME